MTEKQKSTITQMRASGMTVKDIATQLDLSPETVKSYLSRSRQSSLYPAPPLPSAYADSAERRLIRRGTRRSINQQKYNYQKVFNFLSVNYQNTSVA